MIFPTHQDKRFGRLSRVAPHHREGSGPLSLRCLSLPRMGPLVRPAAPGRRSAKPGPLPRPSLRRAGLQAPRRVLPPDQGRGDPRLLGDPAMGPRRASRGAGGRSGTSPASSYLPRRLPTDRLVSGIASLLPMQGCILPLRRRDPRSDRRSPVTRKTDTTDIPRCDDHRPDLRHALLASRKPAACR